MFIKTLRSAALVAGALAFVAGDAFAHGGQFRGPNGRVPRDLRDPVDSPTPPPLPSPTTPGQSPGTPVTPGPSVPQPPITGPIAPRSPSQPPPSGGTSQRPRKRGGLTPGDWTFWWGYNKDSILDLKARIYDYSGSDHPIGIVGDANTEARGSQTHRVRSLVESDVLPAMRWAIEHGAEVDSDIESAAYIGLAKVARHAMQIDGLMKPLDHPRSFRPITVESAAMALGLLRRASSDEQLSAVDLDRVRARLIEALDDDKLHTRARAFAAMSLGLLGDQPTGSHGTGGPLAAARSTTKALLARLGEDHAHADIPIAIITALGLQPSESFGVDGKTVLRELALRGRLGRREMSSKAQAHAVLSYARVTGAESLTLLQRLVIKRTPDSLVPRSAALGIGRIASRLSPEKRILAAKELLRAERRIRDTSTRHFVVISLADLVASAMGRDEADVLDETRVGSFLVKVATRGNAESQPYGALALGLALRAMGGDAFTQGQSTFRKDALAALADGLQRAKGGDHGRAAFALALGIAKDVDQIRKLTEVVDDASLSGDLRGYAAMGIGLMGHAPRVARASIRSALREHRSEAMRVHCATALGLLSDGEAVPILVDQLKTARTQSLKGQLVVALARIGNHDAVRPLIGLLKDPREQVLTRALACAGLGVVGDMEPIPSVSLIAEDLNFRAPTDALLEWTSIL